MKGDQKVSEKRKLQKAFKLQLFMRFHYSSKSF